MVPSWESLITLNLANVLVQMCCHGGHCRGGGDHDQVPPADRVLAPPPTRHEGGLVLRLQVGEIGFGIMFR